MARTISDIVDLIRNIARKQRGVFLVPAQVTTYLYAAHLDAIEKWFEGYGEDQSLHDALRPQRISQPFTSDSSGFVTFPSNYIHILGGGFTVAGSTVNPLNWCNEDELPFALTSQLRPVSNSYPLAIDSATGFSIYPQTTQVGMYFYLRLPAVPVYGYTQVGRDITYNPATSVQLEVSDQYVNVIISLALKYVGVSMSETEISAFADSQLNIQA